MPANPPSVQERRERLLADPRVSGWFKNRGKRSTAESYLANLELFLRRTKTSVAEAYYGTPTPGELDELMRERPLL